MAPTERENTSGFLTLAVSPDHGAGNQVERFYWTVSHSSGLPRALPFRRCFGFQGLDVIGEHDRMVHLRVVRRI